MVGKIKGLRVGEGLGMGRLRVGKRGRVRGGKGDKVRGGEKG